MQVRWVRLVVTLGLLAGMGISWKLWFTGERLFPVLPFAGFPSIPVGLEMVLLGALLLCLLGAFFKKFSKWASISAVVILLILAGGDQMRWQPWAYQYLLMLLPFVWLSSSSEEALLLKTQRLIVIAVYFWSGYHKLSPNFEGVWLETFAAPIVEKLDEGSLQEFVKDSYRLVPWMEMGLAVLLLIARIRWIAVALACLMHLGILIMIGPLVGDWNVVVWPWNLAMIFLVLILFLPRERGAAWRQAGWGSRLTLVLVAGLACVMPGFSEKGKWDRSLSFHLYTGMEHRYSLILFPNGLKKLPEQYHAYLVGEPNKLKELNASTWAAKELNVPAVSEGRVMLQWCRAVMEAGQFEKRDCFIHHDVIFSKTLGHQQLWPKDFKKMKEIAPLPVKDE